MVINITNEAYNDIVEYYDNVMIAHPNTFDVLNAIQCVDEVYNGIISRINEVIGNEREPLLQSLKMVMIYLLTYENRVWGFE